MQEERQAPGGDDLAVNLAFWRSEAQTLKETADLCWSTERRALEQESAGGTPLQQQALNEAGAALGVELELLYRYLIALAIQYLAIGILIDREPDYFLHRPPGHRILALLHECAVIVTPEQQRLLSDVENAFVWGDRYPVRPSPDGDADTLAAIAGRLSGMAAITAGEKAALDALYDALRALAQEEATH